MGKKNTYLMCKECNIAKGMQSEIAGQVDEVNAGKLYKPDT